MQTINDIQEEIIEEFEVFEDFMDRYAYIIELGSRMPAMDEALKVPDNLIEGCQSRVWIDCELSGDGAMTIVGDSDSSIVKGLVALVVRVLSGQRPADIAAADLFFIERIGLRDQLTPNRSNGLLSIIKRIKGYAVAYGEVTGGAR